MTGRLMVLVADEAGEDMLGRPMLILRISSMTNNGGTRIKTSTMPSTLVRMDMVDDVCVCVIGNARNWVSY